MKKVLSVVLILLLVGLVGAYEISGSDSAQEDIFGPSPLREQDEQLVVDGLVERELELSVEEIRDMPSKTVNAELYCVGTEVPAVKGDWTGVELSYLLDSAGVKEEAIKVALFADDKFTTDLPVETAMSSENIVLAYERDGEPLDENVRLVVPGRWGYKWIAWLRIIRLVDFDFKGVYESGNYSDEAIIPFK